MVAELGDPDSGRPETTRQVRTRCPPQISGTATAANSKVQKTVSRRARYQVYPGDRADLAAAV